MHPLDKFVKAITRAGRTSGSAGATEWTPTNTETPFVGKKHERLGTEGISGRGGDGQSAQPSILLLLYFICLFSYSGDLETIGLWRAGMKLSFYDAGKY